MSREILEGIYQFQDQTRVITWQGLFLTRYSFSLVFN